MNVCKTYKRCPVCEHEIEFRFLLPFPKCEWHDAEKCKPESNVPCWVHMEDYDGTRYTGWRYFNGECWENRKGKVETMKVLHWSPVSHPVFPPDVEEVAE